MFKEESLPLLPDYYHKMDRNLLLDEIRLLKFLLDTKFPEDLKMYKQKIHQQQCLIQMKDEMLEKAFNEIKKIKEGV